MRARRGSPRKVDANQAEIVAALRDAGCEVFDISATGGGVPDLVVRLPNDKLLLVEVKNPAARGKLNKLQEKFHARWSGVVSVVNTVDEARGLVGTLRRQMPHTRGQEPKS